MFIRYSRYTTSKRRQQLLKFHQHPDLFIRTGLISTAIPLYAKCPQPLQPRAFRPYPLKNIRPFALFIKLLQNFRHIGIAVFVIILFVKHPVHGITERKHQPACPNIAAEIINVNQRQSAQFARYHSTCDRQSKRKQRNRIREPSDCRQKKRQSGQAFRKLRQQPEFLCPDKLDQRRCAYCQLKKTGRLRNKRGKISQRY